MLDIVLLIVFTVAAIRVAKSILEQSAIFEEFKQSRALAAVVFLFPLGPILLMVLPFRVGWLPAAAAGIACYLPAFAISRRQIKVFDTSGTDRTKVAQSAAHQAFGTALAGFAYVALFVILLLGVKSSQ